MAPKYINKLEGRLVVIIGGTSGIGFAVAEACIEHGVNVVVASRKQQNVDSTVATLKKTYPDATSNIHGHTCDLSLDDVESQITELFDYATNGGASQVDHVVHTAGEPGSLVTSLETATSEAIAEMQKLRFIALIMLAKVAQRYLKPAASSSFTMTSGVLAHRPLKGSAIRIAASTGAKEVLTKGLAVDLAPIRVNVVSPGAIQTPMLDSVGTAMGDIEKTREFFRNGTLVGAIGTPEDCAEAYLCSIKNNFMTGVTLHAEGGQLLKT